MSQDEVVRPGNCAMDLTAVSHLLGAHAQAAWDLVDDVAPGQSELGHLVALGHGLGADNDLTAVARAALEELRLPGLTPGAHNRSESNFN